MREQAEPRVFPVTAGQLSVALFCMIIVWSKWVPDGYYEDQQTRMLMALIPGVLGLISHVIALLMRFFFRNDERDALLYWRIGLWLQALGFLVYVVTRTMIAVENL
jgi:hypothetical protein